MWGVVGAFPAYPCCYPWFSSGDVLSPECKLPEGSPLVLYYHQRQGGTLGPRTSVGTGWGLWALKGARGPQHI